MHEARMTFGEHLEDLRRRIICCLLYLVVGLSISMTYGQDLLQWVLVPHYTAVRTENRARLVRHMDRTLHRVLLLTSVMPQESERREKPLLVPPPTSEDWAALFAREVALPQITGRLQGSFEKFSRALGASLTTIPVEEREKVRGAVKEFGTELSTVLAEEFAPGLQATREAVIPERFRNLYRDLSQMSSNEGPSQLEKIAGWGGDVGTLIEPLHEFIEFLDGRKAQVMASPIPLERLHAWARESKLPDALGESIASLEKDYMALVEQKTPSIMVTSYLESFMAYLKVAMVFGIFLTLPFMLYELWKFIGAGLYEHEQKYVVTFLPFSLGLFVVGILFGYFAMIPVGLKFLAGWGIEDVNLSFTLENYIDLFLTLTLILGLVFQTPLLMVFFTKIGVVNVPTFRRVRRLAIFACICLAVVLTPPDPFSWSLMAAPMILLYELGIWICQFFEPKKLTKPVESGLLGTREVAPGAESEQLKDQ